MVPLRRERFLVVHLYSSFSKDPLDFPLGQIFFTKNYYFWRFKCDNGKRCRDGGDLGLPAHAKFVKIA